MKDDIPSTTLRQASGDASYKSDPPAPVPPFDPSTGLPSTMLGTGRTGYAQDKQQWWLRLTATST